MVLTRQTNRKNNCICRMLIPISCMILLLVIYGCKSNIEVQLVRGNKASASVVSLKPISAKPGQVVTITGSGFNASQKNMVKITTASGGLVTAPVTVTSATEATFMMPEGAGLGLTSLMLESNANEMAGAVSFVADLASNALPILIIDQDQVCSTVQYIDRNGETLSGTKNCALTAPDCTGNAVVGCVTTNSFKSADLSNLTEANIKFGVTIAGINGAYPSAQYRLAGADNTADLTSATFNAQVKTSQSFAWFDATGGRHLGTGDSDINSTNIILGVTVFGTDGSAQSATAIDPWDLRFGVTANGVTGKLKVNCRNGAKASWDLSQPIAPTADIDTDRLTFAGHGYSDGQTVWFEGGTAPTGLAGYQSYYVVNSDSNSFQLSSTSGGAAIDLTATGSNFTLSRKNEGIVDLWDTIDDLSRTTSPWSEDNRCGGVETSQSDSNVWKDVTSTTCDSALDQCRYLDKITKLEWSEVQNGGVGADWGRSRLICDGLTFDGQSDWRSPTQKELMEAYNHGIYSATSAYWLTSAQLSGSSIWSSTHIGATTTTAWNVNLSTGFQSNVWWTYVNALVVCVRGG